MKKILYGFACIMMMCSFTSVNAVTIHNYDDWKTDGGNGSKERISDLVTNLKGANATGINNTYDGPYAENSEGNLKDGFTEEVNIELKLDDFANNEKFYVSNSVNYIDSYSTELFVTTTRTSEGFEITTTAKEGYKYVIKEDGIYAYQWVWSVDDNIVNVVFNILKDGKKISSSDEIAIETVYDSTSGEYEILTLDESEVEKMTPGYLWFFGIEVAKGVNVYAHLPIVVSAPQASGNGEVKIDDSNVKDFLNEALENNPDLKEAAKLNDVTLEVDSKKVEDIEEEEKSKFEGVIENGIIAEFFDITISAKAGDVTVSLTELSKKIPLTIGVPEAPDIAEGYTRTYYILREHDGKVEKLDAVLSDDGKTLTFESDLFSRYAIAYVDTKNAEVTPDTPNTNDKLISYMVIGGISISALVGMVLYQNNRKEYN